jgi:hypothetical protein
MSVVRFPAPMNEPPPEDDFEYSDSDAPDAPPVSKAPSAESTGAGPRKTPGRRSTLPPSSPRSSRSIT